MQLNIHLMANPIIQNISQEALCLNTSSHIKNQAIQLLGILTVYDITRNWLKSYKLKFKQTQSYRELTYLDPKESHIFISNSLKNLRFFHKAEECIPKSSLELVKENEIDHKDNTLITFRAIDSYTKIIIFTEFLKYSYTIKLLKYLINKKHITIDQIRLVCIVCKADQLIQLGKEYKQIKVYTTKLYR